MKVEIRQGNTAQWLRLETGACYRLTDLENTKAFKADSWEKTTVHAALRDHGQTYAAYVWAIQNRHGSGVKVYHAWKGVVNALGHTGGHMPPTKAVRDTHIFGNGQSISDCPVIAETEL